MHSTSDQKKAKMGAKHFAPSRFEVKLFTFLAVLGMNSLTSVTISSSFVIRYPTNHQRQVRSFEPISLTLISLNIYGTTTH